MTQSPSDRAPYRRGRGRGGGRLTSQEAALIRYLYQFRKWTLQRLADEFNLSVAGVHKITTGKTWRDVDVTTELARLVRRARLVQGFLPDAEIL